SRRAAGIPGIRTPVRRSVGRGGRRRSIAGRRHRRGRGGLTAQAAQGVPVSGMIVPVTGMSIPEMGTKAANPPPAAAPTALADVLFTPVQQRVLGLLFGQPERRYQSAELIRLAGSGTGSVHRQLTRLAQVGLVTAEAVGNQKFYQANPHSPVFAELVGLVRKTVGLVAPIQL